MTIPAWTTSDTHLGHARIREYCPWRATWTTDIEDMNRQIIEAWNATVGAREVVLHCGDLCFGKVPQTTDFIHALNGHILLVCGNHDRSPKRMQELGVWRAEKSFDFLVGGKTVRAIHDPADAFEIAHTFDVILHGHRHGDGGLLPAGLERRFIDVGIDARRSKKPVRITTLLEGLP